MRMNFVVILMRILTLFTLTLAFALALTLTFALFYLNYLRLRNEVIIIIIVIIIVVFLVVYVVVFLVGIVGVAHHIRIRTRNSIIFLIGRSIMNRVWIRLTPIRSRCFDESIQIQSVRVSELSIDQTNTTTDNGASHRSRNARGNVWQQDLRGVCCNTSTPVPVDDRPEVESNERRVLCFSIIKMVVVVYLRFGRIKVVAVAVAGVRRQRLEENVDERRASVFRWCIRRVRGCPHTGPWFLEGGQGRRCMCKVCFLLMLRR